MIKNKSKKQLMGKRVRRIRAHISGTAERPRLCINKSNYALYAQVINDQTGKTISNCKTAGKNVDAAKKLAEMIIKQLKSKKISTLVFDRRGYRYHGAIKALTEAVREGGIQI